MQSEQSPVPSQEPCISQLSGHSGAPLFSKHPGYKVDLEHDIFLDSTSDSHFVRYQGVEKNLYNKIYDNRNNIIGYDRYEKYAQLVKESEKPLEALAGQEDVYWAVKEALESITSENQSKSTVRILEIGSGLGYLTYSLNNEGYNAIGLDISQSAVDAACKRFGDFYTCNAMEDVKEKFDVVISTEVIEHCENPLAFMKDAKRLLASNGRIIITTANKSIYSPALLWHTDPPPVHLWWLSEPSFYYLAGKLDMKLELVDFYRFYHKNKRKLDFKPSKSTTFDENYNVDIRENWVFRLTRMAIKIAPQTDYFFRRSFFIFQLWKKFLYDKNTKAYSVCGVFSL